MSTGTDQAGGHLDAGVRVDTQLQVTEATPSTSKTLPIVWWPRRASPGPAGARPPPTSPEQDADMQLTLEQWAVWDEGQSGERICCSKTAVTEIDATTGDGL